MDFSNGMRIRSKVDLDWPSKVVEGMEGKVLMAITESLIVCNFDGEQQRMGINQIEEIKEV